MTSLIWPYIGLLILRVYKATPDQRLQTLQRVGLNTFVMAHRFSTNSHIWVLRLQRASALSGPLTAGGPLKAGTL